jgi:hypothetical protein
MIAREEKENKRRNIKEKNILVKHRYIFLFQLNQLIVKFVPHLEDDL